MNYTRNNLEDTICALATPMGIGAIGVIRISGPNAISIVSKLDAVPVVAVLFIIYFIDLIFKENFIDIFRKNYKPFLLCFLIPLAVWILFSYFFFGSPLPQSAKAKLMYHSGSIQSTFPFLEVFINDAFRMPLLILLGLFLA